MPPTAVIWSATTVAMKARSEPIKYDKRRNSIEIMLAATLRLEGSAG